MFAKDFYKDKNKDSKVTSNYYAARDNLNYYNSKKDFRNKLSIHIIILLDFVY